MRRGPVRGALVSLALALPAGADGPGLAPADEEALLASPLEAGLDAEGAQARVQLLREGVDLETVSRARLQAVPGLGPGAARLVAHRAAHGQAGSLDQLVDAGVLDPGEGEALAPYLAPTPRAFSGRVHLAAGAGAGDAVPPPLLLEASLAAPFGLSAGLELALTRFRPAPAAWDPALQALVTPGFGPRVELPRAFAAWRRGRLLLVAGTFEAGFAERLVLDTTRTERPDGFTLASTFRRPLDATLGCHLSGPGRERDPACAAGRPQTADFLTREPLRGVAVSVDEVPLGAGTEGAGALLASWQTPRVAQDELQDPRGCRPVLDGRCPSVRVLTPGGATVVASSLPGVLEELLLGAHAQVRLATGLAVGATGQVGLLRLPGPLGLQPWSRFTGPGLSGAAGLNLAWPLGPVALFAEAARSVDARPGNAGGDLGAVQRTVLTLASQTLELALRWYGPHFLNPRGRPVAAGDLDEGQRARNELGARLSWQWRDAPRWAAWARLDAWTNPAPVEGTRPAWAPGVELLGRLDVKGPGWLRLSAFGEARRAPASAASCALDDWGLPTPACAAARLSLGARAALELPVPAPRLLLRVWAARVDPGSGWRTDGQAEAEARWAPLPALELRGGLRALVRGLGEARPAEARLLARAGAAWAPWPGTSLDGRYELWADLLGPALAHRFALDLTAAW